MSQLCGVTYRLRNKVNLRAAKNMYYSCVYSVLTYALGVWGGVGMCTGRCSRLNSLHKRVVKNLFKKFYPDDESCLFKQMSLLKLKDIYRLRVCVYVYRVIKLNQFPSLQGALDLREQSHSYATRVTEQFVVSFPRVEAVRMSFKYQFVKIWNTLPNYIKTLESLKTFKAATRDLF